jgi:hypothetical protein
LAPAREAVTAALADALRASDPSDAAASEHPAAEPQRKLDDDEERQVRQPRERLEL